MIPKRVGGSRTPCASSKGRAAMWVSRIASRSAASEKPGVGEACRSRGDGRLRLLDDRLERVRLADGDVGQDLAVDLDPGLAEAGDKSTVGQPVLAHRSVEPLDPQRPKAALAV